MPDLAFTELLVLVVIAVLVVGPKDLPKVVRGVGQAFAKVRKLAREFQSGLDQLAHEAELDEVKKQAEHYRNLYRMDPKRELGKFVDRASDEAAQPKAGEAEPAEDRGAVARESAETEALGAAPAEPLPEPGPEPEKLAEPAAKDKTRA